MKLGSDWSRPSTISSLLPWSGNAETTLGFVWNRPPWPVLTHKRGEIIFAECLAMFYADERLDFASLTRLLTELENLPCD
jgi:hypothetical protein